MNKQTRIQVYDKFGGHCAYCGCELTYDDMQVDHIAPKMRGMSAEGGTDDVSNYNPACRACNVRKGTMSIEQYRYELEQCHNRMLATNANYRQLVRYGQIKLINEGKVIFYFQLCEMKTNYIDLGLPSGNLWAETNEEGYYTYDEAVEKYGDSLPTKEDFKELLERCYHKWDSERKGIEFLGPNGNKLFFPAKGYRGDSSINCVGSYGLYWSSSSYTNDAFNAYYLYFYSNYARVSYYNRNCGQSVRLIKRK